MQASLMRCFLFLRFFAAPVFAGFRWRNPEGVRLRFGEHVGTVGFDCGTKVGTRFTVRSKGDRPECRTDRRAAPPRLDADSTRLP